MPRATNAPASKARRKKILKQTKGYFGSNSNVYTVAKNVLEKGLGYAYRDRKAKKVQFRALWIQRINAGVRLHGMSYSEFIGKLDNQGDCPEPQDACRPCNESPRSLQGDSGKGKTIKKSGQNPLFLFAIFDFRFSI